ncbi:MAG: single-stranded DNA-binding protein [Chitinophagaceae bacterium]|nr:MAG: single-stranded DNA-binding protein [Chitinophagaceae bacterium]
MNALKNKVQLIGNLGMNPEVRVIDGGRKLAKFSMAIHENYKNAKGEWVKQTQWHNIVAWGKAADLVEAKLQKGNEVMIEGKLVHREYTDKEGVKRHFTEVQMIELLLMSHNKAS